MRSQVARAANLILAKAGLRLMTRASLYPWQDAPAFADRRLPDGAEQFLTFDNPRLRELVDRYKAFDPAVTTPAVWTDDKLASSDLLYFRGDNPFVWQSRGLNYNELTYTMSYYALKSGSCGDLLAAMSEDGLFGAHAVEVDGRLVTRDLLDSVGEIDFLKRHVGLDGKAVLDIGAGYGRLAHRLTETVADVTVYATDGYATSTFLAEYYLAFRKAGKARAVPLDEVEQLLSETRIEVATNVHSFSECTPEAVAWWATRLAEARVPWLMVVPNGPTSDLEDVCRYNSGEDMEATLARCGFRPTIRELRYRDPAVQKYGVDPCRIVLFELR